MGTDSGLVMEDGPSHYTLPAARKVRCCYCAPQGTWWLGTDAGIVLFDTGSGRFSFPDGPFRGDLSLQKDQINFICEVAPMQLLIGTAWDGVWFYDMMSQTLSHNQPSKYNPWPSPELNCCYMDRQGNAWIGTYDKGYVVAGKQSDLFNEDKKLSSPLENKFVTRIVEDSYRFCWIATRYDGLYRYSPSGVLDKIDLSSVQPSGGDYLEGVFVDSQGRLWLAFEGRLCLARASGTKAIGLATFPLDHVRCIKEDASHTIWIGAWSGIYSYDDTTPAPVRLESGDIVNISDILTLKDGSILFSAYAWYVFYMNGGELYAKATGSGGKGVKAMQITEKTGPLAAVVNVSDEHDLMIINRSGITIRLKVADLRVLGRNTQGVRLIDLKGKDFIASITKVPSTPDEETPETPDNPETPETPENPETQETSETSETSESNNPADNDTKE